MGKTLVIAEKPSVAGDIARAIGGLKKVGDHYEGDSYIVASAVGHLLELKEPAESEEEALKQLGEPHLIAKTIIDSFKASKGPMADFYTEQARNEYSSGTFEEDGSSVDNEDNVYAEYNYKAGFGRNFQGEIFMCWFQLQ